MAAFLFPGQGSQVPGMGFDFREKSPVARSVFDEADALCPPGLLDLVFNGPAEALKETRNAQPALLVVEVAIARHLASAGDVPSCCAGHSLGEYAALIAAGALSFAEGLTLVMERARCMAEHVAEGGMCAVMGLGPEAIEAALPEGVQVANYNGPQQTIISGGAEALTAAGAALKEAGARRVLPLKVSGPFHSALMAGAADAFGPALERAVLSPPEHPFISSVSGRQESDPDTIRDLLGRQICAPVRWTDVMLAMGCGQAIEVGPGKVLQGIAKRIEGAPAVALAGTLEEANSLEINT
jgi:[acyl-carrier-protein] S-malonyltransferase